MKTAAAYIRVSTDDQLEYSPDSQLKVIQDYAEKNNIVLLEDYIFMEESGKSGKSMAKRDKFLELIAVSKKKPKPFDYILVWKFSRFARNQEEAIVLKSMLKRNEIEVISISEPLPEGPFGELVERVIEWSDAYYLVNLSQEVQRGMREKASRGEPVVPPPFGYDSVDNQYIPNEKAEFVKQIFADYISGMGLREIAKNLNALGVRSKRGNPMDNRGIEYILRNPVYCGKIRWSSNGRASSTRHFDNDNIILTQGNHIPIISEEVFEKVQNMLDEKKKLYGKFQRKEQPVKFMLKGLIRCSNCGATLVFVGTQYPSLQCHNYARGSCNISHCITVKKSNEIIIEALKYAVENKSFRFSSQAQIPAEGFDEKTIARLIENEKAKLQRITASYQDGIDTLEEYKQNKQRINETIKKLQSTAKPLEKQIDTKSYANKVFEVLQFIQNPTKSEEQKNKVLRTVIEKIIFNKSSKTFELYFH